MIVDQLRYLSLAGLSSWPDFSVRLDELYIERTLPPLGLGAGKKVPSWDEAKKEFVPKTEAQITLSFDHRSSDGGGSARLLKRVIELLENPKEL